MQTAPETIGGYKVVRELGRGAMGTVYLAYQESLGRDLAVKLMAPEFTRDTEFVERFRREGRIAARLRHPNIVQVYDFSDRDGLYYIAMEYLGSRTLKSLVQETGRVPLDEAVRLTEQLLNALEHAHAQGIVHRDIKPANVMVTDQGDAALTDFSIAFMKSASKLTQTGSVLGTPEYMAPEQFEGKSDLRSDLYATGVILYEMLTGFSPFHADTIAEVMKKQLFVAPDAPSVVDFTIPEPVSQVVVKSLAKEPSERYQTASEMRIALRQALTAGGSPAVPPETVAASAVATAPLSAAPPPPVATAVRAESTTSKSCPACGKILSNQRFCPGCGHDSTRPAKGAATPARVEPVAAAPAERPKVVISPVPPTPAPAVQPQVTATPAAVAPAATATPTGRQEAPPRLDLRPSDSLVSRAPDKAPPPKIVSPTAAPAEVATTARPLSPPLDKEKDQARSAEPEMRSPGLVGRWLNFLDDQGVNFLAMLGAGCVLLSFPAKLAPNPFTLHLLMGGILGSLFLMCFSLALAIFLGVRGSNTARILAPLLIALGLVVLVSVVALPIVGDADLARRLLE